jgi:2-amino-4-hydroxy-6-hydroxymethyldihydropteridine diphosphokinase
MARIFIGIGSNLGDRAAHLFAGVAGCARHGMRLKALSSIYETAPVGGPAGQPPFLNAVAEFESGLDAAIVLRILQGIEMEQHRSREVRFGPRTLDLDLLLCGDQRRETPDLVLPHPRLHERLFVLRPLAEIDPRIVIPGVGRTAGDLAAERAKAEGPDAALRYAPHRESGARN